MSKSGIVKSIEHIDDIDIDSLNGGMYYKDRLLDNNIKLNLNSAFLCTCS